MANRLISGIAALGLCCGVALPADISLEVATSADGASIRQGEALRIGWRAAGAPEGSTVALQLQKVATRHLFLIVTGLPHEGEYAYAVPVFVVRPVMCVPDPSGACVNDINPDTSYTIVATLSGERPQDATLVGAMSGTFAMLPASAKGR
ncbi:MAG: hypothetical protein ACHQAQ_02545 [Hyphomicrobiales bacterium]